MTAARAGRVTAFLCRAVLLAGFLAVVTGILGMHIMTGAHSMPASAPVMGMATEQIHSAAGHPGGALASSPRTTAEAASGMAAGPSSPCANVTDCPRMSAMDGLCIPSPANTSMSAPPPGTTPFQTAGTSVLVSANTSYSYLPESPSPGDLCISRT
jgi:hypothetical protein